MPLRTESYSFTGAQMICIDLLALPHLRHLDYSALFPASQLAILASPRRTAPCAHAQRGALAMDSASMAYASASRDTLVRNASR